MDSYTVQYSASVRGCTGVQPTQGGPITISGTSTMFTIPNLEEDSDVSGTVSAVNIRGTTPATFNTRTTSASMCCTCHSYTRCLTFAP